MKIKDKYLLLDKDTALVIIDIQERLLKAMPQDDLDKVIRYTNALVDVCNLLGMPVIETKQYVKGLGDTSSLIAEHFKKVISIEKLDMSACKVLEFNEALKMTKVKNVIIVGMETHVCVLQTTIELLDAGYNVHVVSDACVSRSNNNKENGLAYMRQAGAVITNAESVLFQLVSNCKHEYFKTVSGLIK